MSLNSDKIDPDFFGNHVEDSAQSRTALRNGGVSGVMMARLSRIGDEPEHARKRRPHWVCLTHEAH